MTGMRPEFSAAAVATALRAAGHRPTEWRAARQGGYAVLDLGDLGQPRIQVTLTDGPLAFLLPDGHGPGILAAYTAALTAAGYDATISDGGTSILITPLPGQRRPPAAAQRARVTVTVTTASGLAPPRQLQHGRHAAPQAPATAAARARMLGRRARQVPAPARRKAALMLLMLTIMAAALISGHAAVLTAAMPLMGIGAAADQAWSGYRRNRAKNLRYVPWLDDRVADHLATRTRRPQAAADIAWALREPSRDVQHVLRRMAATGTARRIPRRLGNDRWAPA